MSEFLVSARAARERAQVLQQQARTTKAHSVELRLEAEELLARVLMQQEEAVKTQNGAVGMLACRHLASALSAPIPEGLRDAFPDDSAHEH